MTATKKSEKAKSSAKHVSDGAQTLGQTKLIVQEPTPGPIVERTIVADKEIKDITGKGQTLGLVKAIVKMEKPLVEEVKSILYDAKAQVLVCANYRLKLAPGGGGGEVDVEKFIDICEKNKVPRELWIKHLKVVKEVDDKPISFLTPDEVTACTNASPTGGGDKLCCEPNKDAPLELQDAIKTFAQDATKGKVKVPAKLTSGGKTK